jgi:hypothetical protein
MLLSTQSVDMIRFQLLALFDSSPSGLNWIDRLFFDGYLMGI